MSDNNYHSYAILDSNNIVFNKVSWDGDTSKWQPEPGYTAVGIGTTVETILGEDEQPVCTVVRPKHYISIGDRYDPDTGTWIKTDSSGINPLDKNWKWLRDRRDRRLQLSDWKVAPGSPYESKLEEWKTYRQALRDLPANTPDPTNITWPTIPS